MASSFKSPILQAIDQNGDPVPGAKLFVFASDTTTPVAVFSDEALSVGLPNPIIANARGYFASAGGVVGNIFWDGQRLRLRLTDPADAAIWEIDDYTGGGVLPDGGTTNQILRKTSNADQATGWASLGDVGALAAANNLSDVADASTSRTNLGIGNAGMIDQFPGATDTDRLEAAINAIPPVKYVRLTGNTILAREIQLPFDFKLDLGGYTITKDFNGNMFKMLSYATIMNGRIEGNGGTYTGNAITITGNIGNRLQRLLNVDIINSEGYNLEFDDDGSGAGFAWIGGSFFRFDPTLDAIKLPDNDAATAGLRYFTELAGNGAAMMDVSGGRVTYINNCAAASITLRDNSAYVITDESRIVQIIDRVAMTGATQDNPCVVTAPAHGLRNGDSVTFYAVGGMTQLNGFGVTAATQANPCVVTAPNHDFSNGDIVTFSNVAGMTQLNGNNYTLANVDTDTFQLSGTDSTGFGAYTSGGTVAKVGHTVANVDTNTFEISGLNATGYSAYTEGGFVKNRSVHAIRGENHNIKLLFGTSLDGSNTLRLMPATSFSTVNIGSGYSLQDDSGALTNRVGAWPDRNYTATDGRSTVNMAADGNIGYALNAGANGRLTIGTNGSAGVEFATINSVPLGFGIGFADDIVINTDRVNFSLPPVLPAYEVAFLPTPATALIGSMAYATDASTAAVPVYCDGADWRRVNDQTVVTE